MKVGLTLLTFLVTIGQLSALLGRVGAERQIPTLQQMTKNILEKIFPPVERNLRGHENERNLRAKNLHRIDRKKSRKTADTLEDEPVRMEAYSPVSLAFMGDFNLSVKDVV